MKISFEYHKSDLFEIAQKRNADEKNTEKPQMLKNESPVRVDISKEAMDKYRKEVQDKTPVEDEENRILTKEALQKLTESYKDHVKSVKERAEQQRKSEKMLAGSLQKA